jgi:putative DNA primase/helicase
MSDQEYTMIDAAAPTVRTISAAELLIMKLPQREYAIEPILPRPGLAMVYAPRGVGKTFLALSLSYAIACGAPFLKWRAPGPLRVLHVDGEMPAVTLQERLAAIAVGAGIRPPSDNYLTFAVGDLTERGLPNIAGAAGQGSVTTAAAQADVIVLDNLSTLATGLRENEADDWGAFQNWLLALRRAGKLVVLVHHAGKGGQQRGTSRREDALDTVIALRRPADYRPEQGARCEVHIEKARGALGNDVAPFEVSLREAPGGGLDWAWTDLKPAHGDAQALLNQPGMSVREIAKTTGMSKSKVARIKKAQGQ